MIKNFYHGSAKIYQFPVKNHPIIVCDGEETKGRESFQASNLEPVRAGKMTFGSAWYHEEAIRDSKGAGRN